MTTKSYKKRLVLFDAHAILHRAYHALPDFTSSKGEPTGGLYGLASMLIRIIQDLKPDYLAACYDLPEPTFRKQAYDGYKSGRKKIDETLIAQIERSRDIFSAFGIPIYDAPGFEADDVIGTIVKEVRKDKDLQVVIASGDMDTLQLVADDRVIVYTLKKGITDTVIYNEDKVKERYGFSPALLIDYKGLRGDPSDNIIGIVGIGEKTATTLVTTFGTIEAIYRKLKKGEKDFLAAGIKSRIIGLLKDNEEEALFSKTLATIRGDAPIKFSLPVKSWRETFSLVEVEVLFNALDFKSLFSRAQNLLGAPTNVSTDAKEPKSSPSPVSPLEIKKTALALWLIDSEKVTPDLEDIYRFAGTDDFKQAQQIIQTELKKRNLEKVYNDIELPIMPIIDRAERRGILIDLKYLKSLSVKHHLELEKLKKKIYALAGLEFNINSPKQLGEVLFDRLGLTAKGLKKTAGGARSTRESELIKLADSHPIVKHLLSYRELAKLLSTYIDNIPTLVDAENRLHTSLNQAGAATGRMSSSNPGLQNIPASDKFGQELRRAFIASPNHTWVAADYSQIEMRVLAILSGDESLLRIFKEGGDVHSGVAALVFGVPESEITKDMRRAAKVINFGIIYGMGINSLRQNLGMTRSEAQEFYDNFFKTFPKVRAYFDQVITDTHLKGYTETLFGRRRYFPALKSRLPYLQAAAERQANNAPIQGTAADIVKIAMKKVESGLQKKQLINQCHFVLQVHDELIYEVENTQVAAAKKVIKESMESVITETIPFPVEVKEGRSWGELE